MKRRSAGGWLALAMLAGAGGVAQAQEIDAGPTGRVGVSFVAADPVGELTAFIDQGFGLQFQGSLPLDPSGILRLRGDLGFVIYGYERNRLCMGVPVGCRIELDLVTTNNILFGGVGPELALPLGPVEPYVNASFGFSYFVTSSSLSGQSEFDEFGTTTNFDDATLAWRSGAGVRLRLTRGRRPVSLDVGVERHRNGMADFLTRGDIVDHPDGSVTLYPNRAEANLVAFRVGVSVGLPGDGQDDRHR